MGAYILRRLALIIPTLLGIMVINFALVQFVPGGPIEQIIAQIEGGGDVFEGIAGGGAAETAAATSEDYVGGRGLPLRRHPRLPRFPCLQAPRLESAR